MIRIQATDNADGVTIAIDGQLTAEYATEVEVSIRQAIERRKTGVHLFLRNVTYIDDSGHAMLSRLAAQGIALSAEGLYSAYVVSQLQRPRGTTRNVL